jgi:hypothetical protein
VVIPLRSLRLKALGFCGREKPLTAEFAEYVAEIAEKFIGRWETFNHGEVLCNSVLAPVPSVVKV